MAAMSSMQLSLRKTIASWRTQVIYIRIIRLWLGLTWIYAGWDKATDPGFLTKGGPTYIGAQLSGYATQSPISFIFNKMIEHSLLIGIFVILSEFAIGLATLLYVAPTTAALAGFTMSVGLWLASSFHVKPYFLGSDTAYAVLWLTYFLFLLGKRRKLDVALDRRGFMRVGALGITAVAISALGKALPRAAKNNGSSNSAASKNLVKITTLPIGGTHQFTLASGDPAMLFRTSNGVFAYSRVCTHQGCVVEYVPGNKELICPCHGATFDPFNSAQVLAGPTNIPLPKVSVAIKGDWVVLV